MKEKWELLKEYLKKELEEPMNNDDIPKSILESVLWKMEDLEK